MRKSTVALGPAGAILLFLLGAIPAADAGRQAHPTWVLRQVSQTYGAVETFVSKDGIRLHMGSIVVALQPPLEEVYFWNTKTKFYCKDTTQRFKKRIPPEFTPGKELSKITQLPSKGVKIAGLPVNHYLWERWKKEDPSKRHIIYEFWSTRALPLPEKVMDTCATYCYLPPGYGLPLKILGNRPRHGSYRQVTFLTTDSCRKATVPPTFYVASLHGYEKVGSETEVLLKDRHTAKEEDVSDLFKPTSHAGL